MEKVRYNIRRISLCNFGIVWIDDTRAIKITRVYLSKDKRGVLKRIKRVYPEAKEERNKKVTLILEEIKRCLTGKIAHFNLSHLQRDSLSKFQWGVSHAARKIPYGRVITYGGLARILGTKSARAIGNALAKNPFPIIIPCHRIVSFDRKIGGFQSGKSLKKKLLRLEGVTFDKKGRIPEEFFYRLNAIR